MRIRRHRPTLARRSAFAGYRFPPDVIVLAVCWSLRFGLSYRDVEEQSARTRELAAEKPPNRRVALAFDELTMAS
jgi:hypothetical protein